MSLSWWRAHHGMPYDAKLGIVAKRIDARRSDVAIVWVACLDYASQHEEDRGSIEGIDCEQVAFGLDLSTDEVERIIAGFVERGMIANNRLVSWDKRQPQREDPTASDRQRARRSRNVTPTVTQCHAPSRNEAPQIEIRLEEKRREEEKNFFPPLPQPLQAKKVLPMPDFAIEDWFEERMRRHPNKREKMLAKSILCEKGNASDPEWRREFTRIHEQWIASPQWNGRHMAFVPNMAKFLNDETYLYEPPEEKTETQRAMEAL